MSGRSSDQERRDHLRPNEPRHHETAAVLEGTLFRETRCTDGGSICPVFVANIRDSQSVKQRRDWKAGSDFDAYRPV